MDWVPLLDPVSGIGGPDSQRAQEPVRGACVQGQQVPRRHTQCRGAESPRRLPGGAAEKHIDVYRGYFILDLHEEPPFAGERTLEGCQLRFARSCALIAINDEIASDGKLEYRDMPRLHYAGEFDLAQIPIIRLDTRNRTDFLRLR